MADYLTSNIRNIALMGHGLSLIHIEMCIRDSTCTVRCRVPAGELIARAFRKPRRLIAANGNYTVIDELGFFLRSSYRFGKVGMVGQFHSSRLTTPLSVQSDNIALVGIFSRNQQLIARLVHLATAIRRGIPA